MKNKDRYLFEHQVDMSKPKKTVYDVIFRKQYDGEERDIPVGDLPTDLKPTDRLIYQSDPGHFSENNSWDANTEITIERPRLETDEEQKERLEKSKQFTEERKESRRQTYLKLKQEFEPIDEKDDKTF